MLLLNLVTQYPSTTQTVPCQNNLSFKVRHDIFKRSVMPRFWDSELNFFVIRCGGCQSLWWNQRTWQPAFQPAPATTTELRDLQNRKCFVIQKSQSPKQWLEMKNEHRSTMWTNWGWGSVTIYLPVHRTVLWRRWQVLALGTYLVISWLTDKSVS